MKNKIISLLLLTSHLSNGMLVPQKSHSFCKKISSSKIFSYTTNQPNSPYAGSAEMIEWHVTNSTPDIKKAFSLVCCYVLKDPNISKDSKIDLLQYQMSRTDFTDNQDQIDVYKKSFACMYEILTEHKKEQFEKLFTANENSITTLPAFQYSLPYKTDRLFFEGAKTIFHVAAQENNLPMLQEAVKFIPKHSYSIDHFNKDKNTALHIGAENLYIPTIETLCKYEANVNAQNKQGRIPSTVAILSSDDPDNFNDIIKIVQLLKEYGADATIQDKDNKSTLDYVEEGLSNTNYYERRTIYRNKMHSLTLQHYEQLQTILTTTKE